jgi:sterol desaturase/sphingolipid hydroxylase (fatty acid hydroxylase superfamily)
MTEFAAFIAAHEAALRGGTMLALLVLFFGLERALPRRRQRVSLGHATGNLLLGVVNGGLVRLIVPGGLAALALWNAGGGMLGLISAPDWVMFLASLVLLDLVLYWHHRAFHEIPFLWRWHGAHHSDRTLNVTSGLRFHPGEALISTAIKAAAVVLIGAPALAVICFEILLTGASLFNHANWHLGRADKLLQKIIVTPDMHRLHHSRLPQESRMNYGFFLSVWDRLFGSYQLQPHQPHQAIELGLTEAENDNVIAAFIHPFKR